MNTPVAGGGRQAIVSLAMGDLDQLYSAYMPFIRHGGLFVQTQKRYGLGDPVFLLVTLPGSTDRQPVACRVVWVTPAGAQGSRPAGIGLQFDDTPESSSLRNQIESALVGRIESEKPTATM